MQTTHSHPYDDQASLHYQTQHQAHWDTVDERNERLRQPARYYHACLENIYRFLVPAGQRVLEIGCAQGNLLAALNPSASIGVTALCLSLIGFWAYVHLINTAPTYGQNFSWDSEPSFFIDSLTLFTGERYAYIQHPDATVSMISSALVALTYPFVNAHDDSFVMYHLQNPALFVAVARGLTTLLSCLCFIALSYWVVPVLRSWREVLLIGYGLTFRSGIIEYDQSATAARDAQVATVAMLEHYGVTHHKDVTQLRIIVGYATFNDCYYLRFGDASYAASFISQINLLCPNETIYPEGSGGLGGLSSPFSAAISLP